jgi:hypothetical protein
VKQLAILTQVTLCYAQINDGWFSSHCFLVENIIHNNIDPLATVDNPRIDVAINIFCVFPIFFPTFLDKMFWQFSYDFS